MHNDLAKAIEALEQKKPSKLVSAILRGIHQELQNAGELSALLELIAGPYSDDTGNEQTEEFFDPDNVPEGEYLT